MEIMETYVKVPKGEVEHITEHPRFKETYDAGPDIFIPIDLYVELTRAHNSPWGPPGTLNVSS